MTFEPGLYLCATPIGNLDDITLRVIKLLENADLVAAEDTRKTRSLLAHFQIQKPLVSFHQHNWRDRGPELIEHALKGPVAVVSDAGMPGISDPGAELIPLAQKAQVPITVLPGASAALAALVLSGLPTDRFCFEGFLPRKPGQKKECLEKLIHEERTMIFYEAPHRLEETIATLAEVFGSRQVAVARELTKRFEQVWRGKLDSLPAALGEEIPLRGEFVIVIAGATEEERWSQEQIEEIIIERLQKEPLKKVSRDLAKESGWRPNELYELGLKLKGE